MATPPAPGQIEGLPPGLMIKTQDGSPPTPEQIQNVKNQIAQSAAKEGLSVQQYVQKMLAAQQAQQQAIAAEAEKLGITPQEFIERIRAQQAQQQAQAQAQGQVQGQAPPGQAPQGQAQTQQQQPITPGPPNPQALAVANFLKGQDLKMRTCILQGQRKDMFKGTSSPEISNHRAALISAIVKRALRALTSPAYEKARKKNPLLPEIPTGDRAALENTFKLLPLSLLALRVSKIDPHEGHDHAPGAHKTKRVKGLWTVKIEQQQECQEDLHFIWLYEGSQIKTKLYAAGALAIVFAIVMFPLWPMKMRLGVWYLSMGMLGLVGLFFAMAIFRLILFAITMFAVPPGLWLYPNLFEDVGFFDSFRPVWGWQEVYFLPSFLQELQPLTKPQEKKKGKKKPSRGVSSAAGAAAMQIPGSIAPASATTSSGPEINVSAPRNRITHQTAQVEEVFDDED